MFRGASSRKEDGDYRNSAQRSELVSKRPYPLRSGIIERRERSLRRDFPLRIGQGQ